MGLPAPASYLTSPKMPHIEWTRASAPSRSGSLSSRLGLAPPP
jgi:hypothetical protein